MLRFISSMGRIARIFSASLFILFMLILAGHSAAQTISFTSVPDGFDAGSIELPRPFAGALGVDADSDNIIYAAVGNYQDMNLARIDLNTGAVAIVAEGPFGGLGGIAPLTGGAIVLTDNASAAGGPPDDTILIARDLNRDGDFNDGGEITKLIDPILVNGSWSGAQARRVPKVRKSRLGAGSVMIQTADGAGNAELIVIDNPLRRPSFNLHRNPYFFGFDYNGGFDFDSRGRVIMGTLTASFTGEIYVLADLNRNGLIGAGESFRIISGENGMSDLGVDGEDDIFFAGVDPNFTAAIRTVVFGGTTANPQISAENFAPTDAGFLSGLLINSKRRPFGPNAGPMGATMIVGGYTGFFEAARNLLTLTPSANTAAGAE